MPTEIPSETLIDRLFHWADRIPDTPALVERGAEPLTYRGLADVIHDLRATLNGCGYGHGDRVAIVHPGGADMVAALYGLWGSVTSVPLNPDYTVGEFAIYLKDLGAQALVLAAGWENPARDAADRMGLPVLELARAPGNIAGKVSLSGGRPGKARKPGPPDAGDMAHVLYTSGTTSHAKIVPITHENLAARSVNGAACLELADDDRCLNLMPLFHGHAIHMNLPCTLWVGGSYIALPTFTPDAFFDHLETLKPTWYSGSYTFHQAILAAAPKYRAAIARGNLRFARSGSGRLDPKIARKLEEILGIPILVTYSSTEANVITAEPRPPAGRKSGTVGKPVVDTVAIMDPNGKMLPPGQSGEVVVSGPQVAPYYENDPEATAGAYVDGWFRTGDEAVFDDDGFLTITGRIKDIINRGGEKITPLEIDAVLAKHPDIVEASAFPIPHPTLGEEVAAVVVVRKGAKMTDQDLAAFVRQRLTGFKVPRRFVFVDEIPRGPTGKVQRGRLAKALGLETSADAVQAGKPEEDRPATPLEEKLAGLWAKTLGVDRVGLHDDFFLLGGDSLQAVDLFLEIERTLGQRLPRSALFDAGNVADMAKRIEQTQPLKCLVPIQPDGDRPPFFCVHDRNGEVLNFRDLARHLGPDQPFYGIQSLGLDANDVPLTRIEDMAARYIDEIKRVQPTGPYRIGGYSFGGRVAYVMAQRMRAAGDDVALLALLDAYSFLGRKRITLGEWVARNRDWFAAMGAGDLLRYAAYRAGRAATVVAAIVRQKAFVTAWRYYETKKQPPPRFLRQPADTNILAFNAYRPEPYGGDAVLLKSELSEWQHPDVHDTWQTLIKGRLTVRAVTGRHVDIVKEPHVRVLAAALRECLDDTQAGARPTPGDMAPAAEMELT